MLYYGIELAVGTDIVNLTCESGSTLPSTNLSAGRLFFNTSTSGLYMCDGTLWHVIGGAGSVTSVNSRTGDVVLRTGDLVGLIDASNLPIASPTTLGGVKIGAGITTAIDGTISATSGTVIPPGSKLCWAQPSAPTGWTQVVDASANNRMLRVINTVGGTSGSGGTGGGGYAGTHNPILMNVVPAHTHTITTGTESADHTHFDAGHNHAIYPDARFLDLNNASGPGNNGNGGFSGGQNVVTAQYTGTGYASLGGRSAAHTHSGTTNSGSSQTNWQPHYLNLILCNKD